MAESAFLQDEEVTKNIAFHVRTRYEISDMAGSDIPDKVGRVTRRIQAVAKRFTFHTNAISDTEADVYSYV